MKPFFVLQDGRCLCQTGFIGDQCEHRCPSGYYGTNCEHVCTCKSRARCDHVTGQCIHDCPAGWTGEKCDQRKFHIRYRIRRSTGVSLSLSISFAIANLISESVRHFVSWSIIPRMIQFRVCRFF